MPTAEVDLNVFAEDMTSVHSTVMELCDAADEFGDEELAEAMENLRWHTEAVQRILRRVID